MCLAIPGKIISVEDHEEPLLRSAKVSFGGVVKTVNMALIDDAQPNQYVLVHVGSAISLIDEDEAKKVFDILKEAGDLKDELKWE